MAPWWRAGAGVARGEDRFRRSMPQKYRTMSCLICTKGTFSSPKMIPPQTQPSFTGNPRALYQYSSMVMKHKTPRNPCLALRWKTGLSPGAKTVQKHMTSAQNFSSHVCQGQDQWTKRSSDRFAIATGPGRMVPLPLMKSRSRRRDAGRSLDLRNRAHFLYPVLKNMLFTPRITGFLKHQSS